MNSVSKVIVMGFFLGVSCMVAANSEQEVPITRNPHDQYSPEIYKDYIIWVDERNGNQDIYGYNLTTQEEFQITDDISDQTYPAIYGDIVVWEDWRNGKSDIYGYNLLTREEFRIPFRTLSGATLGVYENIVICIHMRLDDPSIYGYDLLTKEEFHISLEPSSLYLFPGIYENTIVWRRLRGYQRIYVYDLDTERKFKVPETRLFFAVKDQDYPVIFGNTIVWTEDFYNYVYSYDLLTEKETLIAATCMDKCEPSNVRSEVIGSREPAIYEDIIIWVDCRNGNYDICGYNLSTEEEFFVTLDESMQKSPAIYNDTVVWADNRNGNWDIYASLISPPLRTTSFTSRARVVLINFFPVLIVGLLLANIFFLGLFVRHMRKDKVQKVPEQKVFGKSHPKLTLITGCFHFIVGIAFLAGKDPYLGSLWLAISAFWVAVSLWDVKTPVVHITGDEIIVFSRKSLRGKKIRIDAISDIQVEKDKIRVLSEENEKIEINLNSIDEENRSALIGLLESTKKAKNI